MDHTEKIKKRIYFTEEEYALVRLQAQKRGMKPDKYIKEIDKLTADKEKEIMAI